jgi:hypothetical protein
MAEVCVIGFAPQSANLAVFFLSQMFKFLVGCRKLYRLRGRLSVYVCVRERKIDREEEKTIYRQIYEVLPHLLMAANVHTKHTFISP